MLKLKALSLTTTVALLLLLEGCAVQIQDFTACALIPGELGAVCDNFLTSAPQTLTESQWMALEAQWNQQGSAVECTTSDALGNLKDEIEKLCSATACDEQTKTTILSGIDRIEGLQARVYARDQ